MKATPTARVTRESRRMSRVTWGVTFAVSHGTPTRPDPTRPVLRAGGYVKRQSLLSYRASAQRLTIGGDAR